MTGACALCPQVPSACSPSATCTGAAPGPAASAAWPRSAVMLALPSIAATFPCSLVHLRPVLGWPCARGGRGHVGHHELAPFPGGLRRFASVSEGDAESCTRTTPTKKSCPDFTTPDQGLHRLAVSGGSGMEVLLLFLCLKLYFVMELFILCRLRNEGNLVILTVG